MPPGRTGVKSPLTLTQKLESGNYIMAPARSGISMLLRLFVLSSLFVIHAFDLENSVSGRPEVHCGIDNIAIVMHTLKTFKGRLYVQGESEADGCLKPMADGGDLLRFELPIGACNMRRQRTLQPRGVSFSFTVVVSFHPLFVTGSDRAFNVRCFFLESVKALNTEVDVSQLTTETLEQEFPLPQCTYEIREGLDGPSLKFAHVGQKVTHSWHCDPAVNWVYGMLIHSCFADDGRGNKFELVDEHGCSRDPSLLPQIQYDVGSVTAFTHSNVFKYADKLYFTCTVQLCYKHDGGCEGVTPPVCGPGAIPGLGPVLPPPLPEGPLPQKQPKPVPGPGGQHPPPVPQIPDFVPPEIAGRINEFIGNPQGAKREFIPEEEERTGPILPGPPPPSGLFRHRPPFRTSGPYKDSPLNFTETDEVPSRRVNSEFSEATPVEMVTIAQEEGTSTETLWPFTEEATTATLKIFANDESKSAAEEKASKGRRDLKKMETDLAVDVIVLPSQAEGNLRTDTADVLPPPEPQLCLSRTTSILILASLGFLFLVATVSSFIISRRTITAVKKNHPMMDAFH